MIKVGNIIRALLGVGIDANKAVEYAEFIDVDYNGPEDKGGDAYAVRERTAPTRVGRNTTAPSFMSWCTPLGTRVG